jgi:hypothetical protein
MTKSAAKLVVHGAPKLSVRGAREVSSWMRREARRLRHSAWRKQLSMTYRATFFDAAGVCVVARITLRDAANFSARGARRIARWLEAHASYVGRKEYRAALANQHRDTFRY